MASELRQKVRLGMVGGGPGSNIGETHRYAARFDGSPYLPGHRSGGLILAPDRETWNLLRREVFTV